MSNLAEKLKRAGSAVMLTVVMAAPLAAQERDLDDLFEALRTVDPVDVPQVESKIWAKWSKSGSPAMDLLLDRGRAALEADEPERAVEHLSALIDHAPEFAEAYNTRATVYFNQRRLGLALADIRRTLALNPRHFGALSGLAIIMQELDRPELACGRGAVSRG